MRRVLIAIAAIVLIATRTQDALGDCSITMFDMNGTAMLCAGSGDEWQWSGPGGFAATDMCVTVSTPGTYTLRAFDAATGVWSDPCSQLVGNPPAGPSCSIEGADSVCAGSTAHWCAPAGDFMYAWNGPGGFASTSACVDVNSAGTYSLTLADRASGASGEPCTLTLRVLDCSPPHKTDVCPRNARWWSWGCASRGAPMSAAAFAQVAAAVDQRSALWDFGGDARGLCAALARQRNGSPMAAAKRQYAAVLANLSAAALGITDGNAQTIGIDPTHVIEGIRGIAAGTTVGAWAASTEQALLSMTGNSGRERSQRDHCERIRKQAHDINAGARSGACYGQMSGMGDDDDDIVGEPDQPGSSPAVGGASNDPFSGRGRMHWTLLRASAVDLAIVDVTGRRIRHLVSGVFSAGEHEFTWDGRDDDGRTARPGAYFVLGTIGGERTSQRLFLLH